MSLPGIKLLNPNKKTSDIKKEKKIPSEGKIIQKVFATGMPFGRSHPLWWKSGHLKNYRNWFLRSNFLDS